MSVASVYAELRSPLASPTGKGRTKGIQPDYTLRPPPFTESNPAFVVVECKQYRYASADNFAKAVADYSAGHLAAQVLLVNYGTGRDEILERVPAPNRPRCLILPRFRPDEAASTSEFARRLRAALDVDPALSKVELPDDFDFIDNAPWAMIRLEWSESPRDLDLSVEVIDAPDLTMTINYANRDHSTSLPTPASMMTSRTGMDRRRLRWSVPPGSGSSYVDTRMTARLLAATHGYSCGHQKSIFFFGTVARTQIPTTGKWARYVRTAASSCSPSVAFTISRPCPRMIERPSASSPERSAPSTAQCDRAVARPAPIPSQVPVVK